jgi:hypothetical protein
MVLSFAYWSLRRKPADSAIQKDSAGGAARASTAFGRSAERLRALRIPRFASCRLRVGRAIDRVNAVAGRLLELVVLRFRSERESYRHPQASPDPGRAQAAA